MDSPVNVQFSVSSILRIKDFSWVFLVDWIMIVVLCVFVIWYLSQLVGWLLSQIIGWILWHRFGVWVKFEAVKFSLFGARLMFKNVVYIGPNQAFRVIHGNLSWRYWLRHHREAGITRPKGSEESQLPCGVVLELYGLEWFVYNRAYAYEALDALNLSSNTQPSCDNIEAIAKDLSYGEHQLAALLPASILIHNGAMVIGNNETTCTLVISVAEGEGVIDMDHASNRFDRYLVKNSFKFTKPVARLLSNPDHEGSSLTTEDFDVKTNRRREKEDQVNADSDSDSDSSSDSDSDSDADDHDNDEDPEAARQRRQRAKRQRRRNDEDVVKLRRRRHLRPKWLDKVVRTSKKRYRGTKQGPWVGLHRYMADDWAAEETAARLADLPSEYARVSTIFEADAITFDMVFDVLGPTPANEKDDTDNITSRSRSGSTAASDATASGATTFEAPSDDATRVNSGTGVDPIFQVNVLAKNAAVSYGPWADRQRQQLFATFMPRRCVDEEVPAHPLPGQLRLLPEMSLFVELEGQTIIRVPTREASKDQAFAEHYRQSGGELQRNYGWFEISTANGSTISYRMPYYPTDTSGMTSVLRCDLRKPEVRSSVNHGIMLYAAREELIVSQHTPLKWNGLQTWKVEEHTSGLDLFLLREHMLLISDVLDDLSQGPAAPYELFTPMVVDFQHRIDHFSLYLNVNKNNIINNPTALTENTYLVLSTDRLELDWLVPMKDIAPPDSTYRLTLRTESVTMDVSAPPWHTLHGFLESPRLARVDNLRVTWDSSSTNTSSNSQIGAPGGPRNIDTTNVDIYGSHFTLIAQGFVIDYVMTIRENYFGHKYHYQTTEEFLTRQEEDETSEFTRLDPDSDITLHVFSEGGCFIFPSHLYSARENLALSMKEIWIDCRFTNYYMSLEVDFSPITASINSAVAPDCVLDLGLHPEWGTPALQIDSLSARAHRMFGLPPAEPTYVCKWDFDIGDICGDVNPEFFVLFDRIGESFAHSFRDVENKPIIPPPELFDVTFLSADIGSLIFTVRAPGGSYFVIEAAPMKLRSNDLATERYSGVTTLVTPRIQFTGVAGGDVVLRAHTSLYLTQFKQAMDPQRYFDKQQEHIALHDCLFHRCPFLLREDIRHSPPYNVDYSRTTTFGVRRGQPGSSIVTPSISLPVLVPQCTRDVLHIMHPRTGEFDFGGDDESASSESLMSASSKSHYEPSGAFSSATSTWEGDSDGSVRIRHTDNEDEDSDGVDGASAFEFQPNIQEREHLKQLHADFELHPVPWYDDAPALNGDNPIFEYRNVIVQLGVVHLAAAPEAIVIAHEFIGLQPHVDFSANLDKLQIELVKRLTSEEERIWLRMHIVSPSLRLRVCELSSLDAALKQDAADVDRLTVTCNDIDVMFRAVKASDYIGSRTGMHVELSEFLLDLRQAGARNVMDFSSLNALSFSLTRGIFWWVDENSDTNKGGCGSLRFADVDLAVDPDQVAWIVDFCAQMTRQVLDITETAEKAKDEILATRRGKPASELECVFHSLTMAGDFKGIEQDSYVLSRPTGAIQSEAHLRSQVSWRIAMRLRHLFQEMSPDEIVAQESLIARGLYDLPPDAEAQTMDAFRKWRSWEHTEDMNQAEVFKLVFHPGSRGNSSTSTSMASRYAVGVDSFVCRLAYPTYEYFVRVDEIGLQLIVKQLQDTRNINLALSCMKSRAQAGLGVLDVVAVLARKLPPLMAEFSSRFKASNTDAVTISTGYASAPDSLHQEDTVPSAASGASRSESPEAASNQQALQANVSIFIYDMSVEFAFQTVSVELQIHQLQLASTVESLKWPTATSLFHSSTLVCSQGGVRAFSTESRIDFMDFLLTSPCIGYANRAKGKVGKSWATATLHTLSMIIHVPVSESVAIFVRFCDHDLPLLKQLLLKLELAREQAEAAIQKTTRPTGHSVRSVPSIATPHYDEPQLVGINVRLNTIKFRANLLADTHLALHGKSLDVNLRIPEQGSALLQADFDRLTLMAQYKDRTTLAHCQFDRMQSLARLELTLKAAEVFVRTTSVNLETMSMLWILEFVRRHQIASQIREIMRTIQSIDFNAPVAVSESTPEPIVHAPTDYLPFNIRFAGAVEDLQVLLPLDNHSFTLILSNLRTRYETFGAFDDIADLKGAAMPLVAGAVVSELSVWLKSPKNVGRKILGLHLSGLRQQDQETDTLETTSDFCNFELDPETVGALYLASEKLKLYGRDVFEDAFGKSSNEPMAPAPSGPWSLQTLERLRVKLVLSAVALRWFTDSTSKEGIVLGLERLQIHLAELVSQMDLTGAYVTPYVESSPVAMAERANTAYLPKVTVQGIVVTKPGHEDFLHLKMRGESVSLFITPAIALWLAGLITSVEVAKATLAHLDNAPHRSPSNASDSERPQLEEPRKVPPPAASSNEQRNGPWFRLPFSLHSQIHFKKAVLRVGDEGPLARKDGPSLELFSPSVQFVGEYWRVASTTMNGKRDQVLLDINISDSTNTVYPKAMQEIKGIADSVVMILNRRHGQRHGRSRSSTFTSVERPALDLASALMPPQRRAETTAFSDANISELLAHHEVNFKLHMGQQELYLSCMPFAKVGAQFTADAVDFLMTTPRDRSNSYVAIHCEIRGARASLQHMYSREISTSISINSLTWGTTYCRHNRRTPLQSCVNFDGPKLILKLDQLHDFRMFIEIWRFFDPSPPQAAESPEPLDDSSSTGSRPPPKERLTEQYRRAMASSGTMPFSFNLTVRRFSAVLCMGQSIGDGSVSIDRMWIAGFKVSALEQHMFAGVDHCEIESEGRLSGRVDFAKISARMSVLMRQDLILPLIQTSLGVGRASFYVSLDFHPFLTGRATNVKFSMTNQERKLESGDRLFVAAKADSLYLVFTALVASHIFDTQMLFKRLHSQISSRATFYSSEAEDVTGQLREKRASRRRHGRASAEADIAAASALLDVPRNSRDDNSVFDSIDGDTTNILDFGLHVIFNIRFGETLVYVFPTEFSDPLALKVASRNLGIHYSQVSEFVENATTQSSIDVTMSSFNAGLSTIKGGGYRNALTDIDIHHFLEFVKGSSSSGSILNIPECSFYMDTKESHSKAVHFTFSNTFHGSVDVGWNLGSINFIREMGEAHQRAWQARQDVNVRMNSRSNDHARPAAATEADTNKNESKDSRHKTPGEFVSAPPDAPRDITLHGYKYIPDAVPVIEIPQLRDLGEATPPIEWLGVNRERLPSFVHFYLIRNLNEAIDNIETFYSELLGHIKRKARYQTT